MDEEIKHTPGDPCNSGEPAGTASDTQTSQPSQEQPVHISLDKAAMDPDPSKEQPSQEQPASDPDSSASHVSLDKAAYNSGAQTPPGWGNQPMRSAFPSDTNANRSGGTGQSTSDYYMNPASTENYDPNEPEEFSNGYGIASLVLGILSLFGGCCCCVPGFLFSILGIIFGCVQPKDQMDQKPGFAIAGIVLSAIGLVISICIGIYLAVTTMIM